MERNPRYQAAPKVIKLVWRRKVTYSNVINQEKEKHYIYQAKSPPFQLCNALPLEQTGNYRLT